ncbi:MAG: ImmA/IrrE family metallo-endopeptidase [Clostridiales bacterium]|jgi:Zn-dependent peptidase ImmA (M78 family)|nr:ImmA/IrrE family metallo-endopeptidase [Clostridiales bacterium]
MNIEKVKKEHIEFLTPPVDLIGIAKKHDITIFYGKYSDDFSGAIYVSDKTPQIIKEENYFKFIILNSNHAVTRQRFTLAHELGHYFLDYLDESGQYRESIYEHRDSGNRLDKDEFRINNFAAELIMPSESLFKELNNNFFKVTEIDLELVRDLAKIYQVSFDAMRNRLRWIRGFYGQF